MLSLLMLLPIMYDLQCLSDILYPRRLDDLIDTITIGELQIMTLEHITGARLAGPFDQVRL